MQKKRLEEALNAGKLIKLGFTLNFSKPERLNLLYTVRCAKNKVIYANGEVKSLNDPYDDELNSNSSDTDNNEKLRNRERHEEKVEILTLQFNPNLNLLATGNSNGVIQVHDIFSGMPSPTEDAFESEGAKLMNQMKGSIPKAVTNTSKSATYNMPISTLKWYPYNNYSNNLLFYAHVNGYVGVMNRLSMKKMLIIEESDEIAAMDFNIDGSYLATCGKDFCIKIYDTNTNRSSFNKMVQKYGCHDLCHNTSNNDGLIMHTNRLQAVKFSNMSNDVLFSGGWDRSVKMWDRRTKNGLVNTIHGPFICGGDAIDVCNYLVLTASWVKENALELWDIRNCQKRLLNLPIRKELRNGDSISIDSNNSVDSSISDSSEPKKRGEYLYACKFFASNSQHQSISDNQYSYINKPNPDNFSTVIACGSGTQSVHLINYEAEERNRHITALFCKSPLYCLDTMYASSLIACGSMKKYLTLMTTNYSQSTTQ